MIIEREPITLILMLCFMPWFGEKWFANFSSKKFLSRKSFWKHFFGTTAFGKTTFYRLECKNETPLVVWLVKNLLIAITTLSIKELIVTFSIMTLCISIGVILLNFAFSIVILSVMVRYVSGTLNLLFYLLNGWVHINAFVCGDSFWIDKGLVG